MANAITLAEKWQKAVDFKFKTAPLTSGMVKGDEFATSLGQNGSVNLMEVAVDGFGDYDRATGYAGGTTTVTWRPYTLEVERSKTIDIDRLDDQQTMDLAFVSAITVFTDQFAVPEIDAYRFAKLAQRAGLSATPATLTSSTVLQAIDDAEEAMNEAGVPVEGRVFYCTNAVYKFMKQSNLISRDVSVVTNDGTVNRAIERLDNGMPVRKVQQNRFYTQITLNDGSTTFGYTKTAVTGKDINFMVVHEPSVQAIVALNKVKIFGADVNQGKDSNKYQLRMWHDLIVPENKRNAIYLHNKA